jgi:hypothetical protein
LDGPALMVRPDLRDMAGDPEISGPQEREREREMEYPEGTSSPWESTVPSGEPGSQGTGAR